MIGLFPCLPVKYRPGADAFPMVLLLYVSLPGCANICFVAISNQSGTGVVVSTSNLPLAYPLPVEKGRY
jgi:hypothetical protein